MPNLLGLSIDVNTIGWAMIDKESKKIISMGSRIFPIACENYGSGKRELSKRAYKRGKRTTRLRYQRGRKRKIKVLNILRRHGMCPISEQALENFKTQKLFPEDELRAWFQMNPYKLRAKAIKEPLEFVTTLQINDLFLLDLEESEINLEHESNSFIAKHLYRVQKLSSKFYEFRLVHHNDTSLTESPYYIRINNFGHRKTGWQTHNTIKVWMNSIGKLYIKDEAKEFKKSLKTYS